MAGAVGARDPGGWEEGGFGVPSTSAPLRSNRLRALNQPVAAGVRVGEGGIPSEVLLRGIWRRCSRVEEVWRVEDGWWRPRPVRRTYFRLALEDGLPATLYLDHIDGRWWTQRY
jgi:hypothetical protein